MGDNYQGKWMWRKIKKIQFQNNSTQQAIIWFKIKLTAKQKNTVTVAYISNENYPFREEEVKKEKENGNCITNHSSKIQRQSI